VYAKRAIAYFIHSVPGRPRDVEAGNALATIMESDVSLMLYTSFVLCVIRRSLQCALPRQVCDLLCGRDADLYRRLLLQMPGLLR
jgi:hypothetical protein